MVARVNGVLVEGSLRREMRGLEQTALRTLEDLYTRALATTTPFDYSAARGTPPVPVDNIIELRTLATRLRDERNKQSLEGATTAILNTISDPSRRKEIHMRALRRARVYWRNALESGELNEDGELQARNNIVLLSTKLNSLTKP